MAHTVGLLKSPKSSYVETIQQMKHNPNFNWQKPDTLLPD